MDWKVFLQVKPNFDPLENYWIQEVLQAMKPQGEYFQGHREPQVAV